MKKIPRCLLIGLALWASFELVLPAYSSAKDLAGGELVVHIGIPQTSSASLCIKNRCYPVGNVNYGGSGSIACPVDSCSCSWIAANSWHKCMFREDGVDHPMVNFPDDWDQLYLEQTEARYLDANELTIMYRVDYDPPNAGGLVSPKTYVFVDSTNTDGLGTTLDAPFRIYSGRKNWLRNEVNFRRIKAIEAIAGVPFDQLPWMVQMATHDIGQAGIVKYKLGEHVSQNGCDEFYAYFGALYSNNILAPAGDHASYFPYDRKSFLGIGTWSRAGRLIEVRWTNRADIVGGCTNPTPIYKGTNNVYVPRAGDYLLLRGNESTLYGFLKTQGLDCQTVVTNGSPNDALNCCINIGTTDAGGNWSVDDSYHVMMLVDDQGFVPTGVAGDFEINILHKSDMVEATQLRVNAKHIASPVHEKWPCYQPCNGYISNNSIVLPAGVTGFHWDFYMGIADHELGGADPDDESAPVNFGFVAAASGFMF
jgi:hypothetical protein